MELVTTTSVRQLSLIRSRAGPTAPAWVAQAKTSAGPLLLERAGGLAEGPGGVDHIIDDDAGLPLHVADDVHHLGDVGPAAALVDDRQPGIEPLGEGPGPFGSAGIGRNHHHLARKSAP